LEEKEKGFETLSARADMSDWANSTLKAELEKCQELLDVERKELLAKTNHVVTLETEIQIHIKEAERYLC